MREPCKQRGANPNKANTETHKATIMEAHPENVQAAQTFNQTH
jgi:hypothetical protein